MPDDNHPGWVSRSISRLIAGQVSTTSDKVVVEKQLTIVINKIEFATLYCTPEHLRELVLGFLWASGILSPIETLPDLELDERFGVARLEVASAMPQGLPRRSIFAGCGSGIMPWETAAQVVPDDGGPSYDWREISKASGELLHGNSLFAATGGAHAAAMWTSGVNDGHVVIREDIGRHNAVDKIGGYLLTNGEAPAGLGRFLVVTGRISSDLVLKAAWFGFALLVSRGAPTDLAIRYAQNAGITLVGFSRADRMNIYSYPGRITAGPDR